MANFNDLFDTMLNGAPTCPFGSFCTEQCRIWNHEAKECNINLMMGTVTIACEQLINPESIYNSMKNYDR